MSEKDILYDITYIYVEFKKYNKVVNITKKAIFCDKYKLKVTYKNFIEFCFNFLKL